MFGMNGAVCEPAPEYNGCFYVTIARYLPEQAVILGGFYGFDMLCAGG